MNPSTETVAEVRRAKLQSDTDCKAMWEFFDEREPGDMMDALCGMALRLGDSEAVWLELYPFMASKPELRDMAPTGHFYFACAIEHAVRQASAFTASN